MSEAMQSGIGPQEPKLSMEVYASPLDAFNTVAGSILAEAVNRGIVDFKDKYTIDAIDALDTVTLYALESDDKNLWDKLEFANQAYEMDEVRNRFARGIEAVREDGKVRIHWVDI